MDQNSKVLFEAEVPFEECPHSTPMMDYYRGKTIFLTGSTGFLGILYIRKLLSIGIKKLYLLIRAKKDKSPEDRLQEISSGILFSKLKKEDPNYISRIHIIEGDTSKPNLGITDKNVAKLIENVEIVIHAAADVRFDGDLHFALLNNVRGTRDLLQIVEQMKNIEVFAYISTAYSNCPWLEIKEQFYETAIDPYVMIKLAERCVDEPIFQNIEQKIIHPWPNTYVYTKAMAEATVRKFSKKFPICVIRPSIVIATHEDPIPAWTNNIYGLNGVLVACGLGFLRILPMKQDLIGDVVCADYVINGTLLAIWSTFDEHIIEKTFKQVDNVKEPEIYHICADPEQPLSWGVLHRTMCTAFEQYPPKQIMWKLAISFIDNEFWEKLLTIYYHVIPAIAFDIILKLKGKNFRLIVAYRKVKKFMEALKYFMRNEWKFGNDNIKRILAKMSPEDQRLFPSDIRKFHWFEYTYNYYIGLKTYVVLDNENVAEGQRKQKFFKFLHFLLLIFYYSIHTIIFYTIFDHFGFFNYVKDTFVNIFEVIVGN